MRFHNSSLVCLLLLIDNLAIFFVISEDGHVHQQTTRQNFKPKFVDFSNYQELFDKHYESVKEMVSRRLHYLANAMKAFISSVRYKIGESSFYLGVNEMSDWTQNEVTSFLETNSVDISEFDINNLNYEVNFDESEEYELTRIKRDIQEVNPSVEEKSKQKERKVYTYKTDANTLPDEVFADLRTSECYQEVRNQKKCGSCWAST